MVRIKAADEQKRKRFEENQENFVKDFESKEYTFDFEGSVLGSELQNN